MKRTFVIQYLRQGDQNIWEAKAFYYPHIEMEDEVPEGYESFVAGQWKGDPTADERFANVTVVLDCGPETDASEALDSLMPQVIRAMDAADRLIQERHPGAAIVHETSEVSIFEEPGESTANAGGEGEDGIVLVWDPEVLDPDRYKELVLALGDLVRAEGGLGVERIRSRGFGVPCESEVPQL